MTVSCRRFGLGSSARTVMPSRATHQRAISRPVTADGRVNWLEELGFGDPAAADGILTRMTGGVGPTSRLLKHLEPLLLTAFSHSVDPDLALVRFEWVADGPTRAPVIAATLRDAESAVARLARLLGASGAATAILRQDPRAVERVEPCEPAPDATTRYTEALARGRALLGVQHDSRFEHPATPPTVPSSSTSFAVGLSSVQGVVSVIAGIELSRLSFMARASKRCEWRIVRGSREATTRVTAATQPRWAAVSATRRVTPASTSPTGIARSSAPRAARSVRRRRW